MKYQSQNKINKQTGAWVNQQDIQLNGGGGLKFNLEKSAISKYKLKFLVKGWSYILKI